MAKKQIWIDNTRPPTNYIWAQTDGKGNITDVYEYNGTAWSKISISRSASVTDGDGTINAVTLNGDPIQIPYSVEAIPNTLVVRTPSGTIKAVTPSGNDAQEVVTVGMMSWDKDPSVVKFHRGLDATYQASSYKNGIYFATDTGCIYLDGIPYGKTDSKLDVSSITVNNSILSVHYSDGSIEQFAGKDLIEEATESSAGLMSSKAKIVVDKVSQAFDKGDTLLNSEQAKIISDVKSGVYSNIIEKISENDQVLSIKDKTLSADISLDYDESSKRIFLLGKNGSVLGSIDATKFIKDGMITSVHMEVNPDSHPAGTYLVFVWNTDAGKSDPMYVPISSLINIYRPGKGIKVEDNVISIKLADDYLKVTDDGISFVGEDKILAKIAIRDIDSTADSGISLVKDNGVIKTSVNKEELSRSIGVKLVDNSSALKMDETSCDMFVAWENF